MFIRMEGFVDLCKSYQTKVGRNMRLLCTFENLYRSVGVTVTSAYCLLSSLHNHRLHFICPIEKYGYKQTLNIQIIHNKSSEWVVR